MQRFLLLQVIDPHYHRDEALANMRELEMLVETYGGKIIEKSIQHRVKPHPATYIGPGKIEWVKESVKANEIDVVVLNDILNPSLLFRVEKILWETDRQIEVWDRVDLILNIFDKHAFSKEAKLQIELARLSHAGPRIYGLGGTVLSRQGGGIGTRGKGETNIEFERRLIKDKTAHIKKQLKHLSEQKKVRLEYRREQGIGPVALVGYTSAGKTTLFNAITGKAKQAHAGLFTTLDTVVGKMKTADGRLPVLISDTIGFIENLPPVLIEAFQSTLMESLEAKLLLHVVDVADPRLERKVEVVGNILKSLQVTQPIFLVFNKTDLLPADQQQEIAQNFSHLPHYFISAHSGQGLPELRQAIMNKLAPNPQSREDAFTPNFSSSSNQP